MPKQEQQKTLLVAAIKDGTVIDHITAGHGLSIIRLLGLTADDKLVTVGLNLPSRDMGHKDLIKVEDHAINQDEANRIAIFAPKATINIIKQYTVVKKYPVTLPEKIEGVIICPNTMCITNHERMSTSFFVRTYKHAIRLLCTYCEKTFHESDIAEYR